MSKTNFYIGFPEFEGLLDAAGKSKTLYLTKTVTTVPAQFNTQWVYWSVNACLINENACLYWRMDIGNYNRVDDSPMFRDADFEKQCSESASQVEKILGDYARELDFNVIRGLIAFPKNLVLMKGDSRLLDYDKTTNKFSRKPAPEAVAAIGG